MAALSDAILTRIFTYLQPTLNPDTFGRRRLAYPACDTEDALTLARLCRSSRRFCALAQPLLYHAIPDHSRAARLQFLRAISGNPVLGKFVVELELRLKWVRPEFLQEAFETACQSTYLSPTFTASLTNALQNKDIGAEESLILALCPNIEVLELSCEPRPSSLLIGLCKETTAAAGNHRASPWPEVPMSRIRDIRLRPGDGAVAFDIFKYDCLFLPHLEILRGWCISWKSLSSPTTETPNAPLSLKRIEFLESAGDIQDLESLLKRCGDLRNLRLEWEATEGGDGVDVGAIGNSLRQHGPKLEVLQMDVRKTRAYSENRMYGRVGALESLCNLRELTVSLDILVGRPGRRGAPLPPMLNLHDILPASLEILRLYPSPSDDILDDQLFDLLGSGRLTKLQCIRVGSRTSLQKDFTSMGWAKTKAGINIFLLRRERPL